MEVRVYVVTYPNLLLETSALFYLMIGLAVCFRAIEVKNLLGESSEHQATEEQTYC